MRVDGFLRWDAIFAISGIVGLVLVFTSGPIGARRLAAAGLIMALAVWWVAVGRRLAQSDAKDGRGTGYLLGVVALFTPAALLVPDCSWILFGLCPQPYLVRPHRIALVWVAVLNVVPPVSILLHGGFGTQFVIQAVAAVAIVTFANFIGTTIDRIAQESTQRAALITELEASRTQIAALSKEAGVTEERERLAGEIHDTLAQGFTSILTLVQAATAALRTDPDRAEQHLLLAAETARENLGEARALVGALTPAALGTGTLVDALRRQADRVGAECGIDVRLATSGDVGALPMPVEVVLLRMAQEALANVRKHSGAATAHLLLAADDGTVRLAVTDDGVGFDPDAPVTGFGLAGMRARVEQIGGSVTVHSGASGTSVSVEVPR